MMTTQEFLKDQTPRAGFWRVRAKIKADLPNETRQEIAVVTPPPPQSRDGDISSLDPVAVPALSPSKRDKKARNEGIVEAYVSGALIKAIMTTYSVSEPTVYNVLKLAGISPKRIVKKTITDQVEAKSGATGVALPQSPPLPEPAAAKARVAAPVPVLSKTAGTGVIIPESADITPRRNASPMLPVHLSQNGSGPALQFERTPEPVFAAPKPAEPIGSNWIADRFVRINGAISFLKSKCVLVQTVDPAELVKRYRVSGKRYPQYAEEVIEMAMDMGWAG